MTFFQYLLHFQSIIMIYLYTIYNFIKIEKYQQQKITVTFKKNNQILFMALNKDILIKNICLTFLCFWDHLYSC